MTGLSVGGAPRAAQTGPVSWLERVGARPRRTRAAFVAGAGLLAIGLGSLQAGIAAGIVTGASGPLGFIVGQSQRLAWRTPAGAANALRTIESSPVNPDARHKPAKAAANLGAMRALASLPRHSVCVRLCDGYFFPVGAFSSESDLNNHEAACSGLCPDSPTRLFIEPAGSDRIQDAVSRDGAPYSALPTAFDNRVSTAKSCTCHRRAGGAFPLANDFTLRSGDSIMTASGFLVFKGGGHAPYVLADFTRLADASMSSEKRTALAAIERATLPNLPQSVAALAPPRRAEIAFAAPPVDPAREAAANRSIRFAEPIDSARN
ncbi:MAG: DUF2865 domain-containing protein [Roseiarcus sp.]|jgi:hypothetical protein